MAEGIVDLQPPLLGLNRAMSFQGQPPYSTSKALNVRPYDVAERRARIGSRPGLRRVYADLLGSGSPIRMLNSVQQVTLPGGATFKDEFPGTGSGEELVTNSTGWTALSYVEPIFSTNSIVRIFYVNPAGDGQAHNMAIVRAYVGTIEPPDGSLTAAVVHDKLPNVDASQPYRITVRALTTQGDHGPASLPTWTGQRWIMGMMDDTNPAPQKDCFVAQVAVNHTTLKYDVLLHKVVAGARTSLGSGSMDLIPVTDALDISVSVSGSAISVFLNTTLICSGTYSGPGTRFGFGLKNDSLYFSFDRYRGYLTGIDSMSVSYTPNSATQQTRRTLVSSSAGKMYLENDAAQMIEFSGTGNAIRVRSDALIHSAERLARLYIADYGTVKAENRIGTGGINASGVLDDGLITNWNALGIDIARDLVVVYNVSAPASAGNYVISSIDTNNGLQLVNFPAGAVSCSYRVYPGAKVLSLDTGSFSFWTPGLSQIVPANCPLIALWQDRMVLGGPDDSPQGWFMSRQGDPYDWNYGGYPGDIQRAIFGAATEAGLVAQALTAIAAINNDFLLFGCKHEMYVLQGNPLIGGRLNAISRRIGIIDKGAWCQGTASEIYFLADDGLYVLSVGGPPQSISRERLPLELIGIDVQNVIVLMQYDPVERGLHIYLTPNTAGVAMHWWVDLVNGGFWPMEVDPTMHPTAIHNHQSPGFLDKRVILGSRDGYLRAPDRLIGSDDGIPFTGYCDYGPIRMAQSSLHDGMVSELVGMPAENSGPVAWSIRQGNTMQAADTAADFESGTWRAGRNFTVRPRMRGHAMFLRLQHGTPGTPWEMENVSMVVRGKGKVRLLT